MLFSIAVAEIRYQWKSAHALLTFAVLFGMTFLLTANAGEFESFAPGGTVLANSPFLIAETLIKLSVLAVFAAPVFIGDAFLRDRQHGFDAILFATPISRTDYLGGRFLGALCTLLLAFSGAPIGMLVGTFWPWADPQLLGPTIIAHYGIAFFGLVIPSLIAISTIVFALATTSRSMIITYMGMLALLAFYLVTGEINWLPPVLDPFAFEVFDQETRYWTAAERNTLMVSLTGPLLASRLLWIGLAATVFAIACRRFSFRTPNSAQLRRSRNRKEESAVTPARPDEVFWGSPRWDATTGLQQGIYRLAFEIRAIVGSVAFVLLMMMAFLLLILDLTSREVLYGVQAFPVTRWMIPDTASIKLSLLAVLAFFSADLVWRERDHGVQGVVDCTPTSSAAFVIAKLGALMAIVLAILFLGVIIAVGIQTMAGYHRFEWSLYFQWGIVYPAIAYFCLAALTVFLQVISPGRYVGMLLFGLFMGVMIVSHDIFGIEHPLASYVFPEVGVPLSDLNGSGRFAALGYWVRAYWLAIAGLMVTFTYLLYQRGTAQPFTFRLRQLRHLREAGFALPTLGLVVALLATSGVIYINTNVVNDFHTRAEIEGLRVDYERKFRQFDSLPMPRTIGVELEVDLYPDEAKLDVRSKHRLENKTDTELDEIHVVFPPMLKVSEIGIEGGTVTLVDDQLVEYYILALAAPMLPGEVRELHYRAGIVHQGLFSADRDTRILANGTFLTDSRLAPTIGFASDYLIDDPSKRDRLGLPPLPRRALLEDESEHSNHPGRQDSDFMAFEATISTSADQIAIAPGRLAQTWLDGNRRTFHYVMDVPIRNFYAIVSGRYQVKTDQWGNVDIEVYHHPSHGWNVDRMIEAVKDSLDFYTDTYGPYPFGEVRIAEFPAYREFTAQAFAGMIAYSEDGGFLTNVRPGDIDMPYYVTAHEMAHQWWGHVVTAANVQGAGFLHETLAQYSALKVMERRYGAFKVRQFLKEELDRYLAGRADDPVGEMPLFRVESQPYVHYRKGAVVMYALADYLGSDMVDRSLRRLVDTRGFRADPYTTSMDLLRILKEEAPTDQHRFIEDMLEKIALVDLKMVDAKVSPLSDGKYAVALSMEARKLYASSDGTESETPMDWPVEIGLFARDPASNDFAASDIIILEKHLIQSDQSTLHLVTDRRPSHAGIDPLHKLIDRDSSDNIERVRNTKQ